MRAILLGLVMLAACATPQTQMVKVRDLWGHQLPTYAMMESAFPPISLTCGGVQYYIASQAFVAAQGARIVHRMPRAFTDAGRDELCHRISRNI
jgi:hypothetical protein